MIAGRHVLMCQVTGMGLILGGSSNPDFSCAVKRRWSTAGKTPPGNWFAPTR
jgi:hypothetical protein